MEDVETTNKKKAKADAPAQIDEIPDADQNDADEDSDPERRSLS